MLRIPSLIAAAALVVWVALLVRALLDRSGRPDRALLGAATVTFALAFVARYLLVEPSFVHANFHGTSLVDSTLAFPDPPTHRKEYGVLGFAWLGMLARVVGGGFETIRAANCVFGAIAVTFAALFARSLAGRDASFAAAAAIGVGAIPLLRIANSEDVHNVGLALASVGLFALDAYFTTASRRALALATFSIVAMCYARQTFFVLLPTFALLALGRGVTRANLPHLASAAIVVLVAALARLVASLHGSKDGLTYEMVYVIFGMPGFVPTALARHPLLDVARFGPLATSLLFVGVARCVIMSRASRAVLAGFLVTFVVTLPFGFPTPGVELAFRLPAILLAVVIAGFGGTFIYDQLTTYAPHPRARVLLGGFLLAVCLFAPATSAARSMLSAQSTDYLEYEFWSRHLHELPRNATLVTLTSPRSAPAYAVSRHVLAGRPDLHVVSSTSRDRGEPAYYLLGAQCWGYSIEELGLVEVFPRGRPTLALQRELVPALFGGRWHESRFVTPDGMRADCKALLEASVPFGEQRSVATVDDVPFVMFSADTIAIGFRRLAPER